MPPGLWLLEPSLGRESSPPVLGAPAGGGHDRVQDPTRPGERERRVAEKGWWGKKGVCDIWVGWLNRGVENEEMNV